MAGVIGARAEWMPAIGSAIDRIKANAPFSHNADASGPCTVLLTGALLKKGYVVEV